MKTIKNHKMSKSILLAIIYTWGLIFLCLTYYLAYQNNFFNNYIFWISIILFITSTFFIISMNDIPKEKKIFFLFLLGFGLYLIHILGSPNNFRFGDELLHLENLKEILKTGNIGGGKLFFEVAKYYPGLEILTAYIYYIANISIFTTAKILIAIVHSFVLVFLFLFFEKISSSQRIAALGSFIYSGASSQFVFFNSIWSYESLGILLMITILFLLSKIKNIMYGQTKDIPIWVLSIIVLFALVITHHFTSYMLLFFVLLLSLQVFYSNLKKEKKYFTFALLTTVSIFSWIVYVANISITYYSGMINETIANIIKFTLFENKIEIAQSKEIFLPHYEVFISTYLYIPLILFLVATGTYIIIKNHKIQNIFVNVLIMFSFTFFLVLPNIFMGSSNLIRLWSFLAIGVSFVGSITIERMIDYKKNKHHNFTILLKILSFIIVISILIGGISIGIKPSHGRYQQTPISNLMYGSSAITSDAISSAEWFNHNFLEYYPRNTIATTRSIYIIFRTYASTSDLYSIPNSWTIFYPKTINNDMVKYLRDYRVSHIIIDIRISKFLAAYGYYFNTLELDLKDYPAYGRNLPLPPESLDKFDRNEFFFRIYDNSNIKIYKFNKNK